MIIALYNFNLFFQTSTKSDLQTQGVVHAESGQWMKYLGVFFPAGYLDSLSPKVWAREEEGNLNSQVNI